LTHNCNNQYFVSIFWEKSEEETNITNLQKVIWRTIDSYIPEYNFNKAKLELIKEFGEQKIIKKLNFNTIINIFKNSNFPKNIDWITSAYIIITPILALYGIFALDFNYRTW
jgi:hypothetical protein